MWLSCTGVKMTSVFLNLEIQIITDIKQKVKDVDGQFTCVWHNESLSNQDRWIGWRQVFESTWLD